MESRKLDGLHTAATVDVHTHFFPDALGDFAATTGDPRWPSLHIDDERRARIMRGSDVFRPVASTCWNPEHRIEAMDAAGIDVQVLSPVPIMLTTWAEPNLAASFARRQNELLAEAAASAPNRFRWLGSVPLQDADLAVGELEHGVYLGMSGVEIGTEVGGRELDDVLLRPFFKAASDLDVAIFIHPTGGGGAIRRQGQPYEFGIGMLTDTAMAVGALLFGGVLEQFPKLRIGLSHGCGSFAWSYPRLARGATMGAPPSVGLDLSRTDALVRRLWVDSLVFDPLHLPVLMERFGADHIVLGSDFPFYPPSWGGPCEVIDGAAARGLCTPDEAAAMKASNGLRFLGIESAAPTPPST